MSTSTEMMVSIRDQNVVKKRAIYTAIGINTDGERDVLGLWTQATEGARFWATVLTNLKQRGVNDILLCCTDGLTGFTQAIEASFPETVHQTCIVHLIRQSLKHLSYQDRRECAGQLRRIYTAPDQDTALAILEELEHAWADDKTRVLALGVWRRAWTQVTPFLAFPDEIRRITYTTNAVESLHAQIRKTIKTRGQFPSDDAAIRLIYLAITRAQTNWRSCYNWTRAMAIFRIHFGDRIPK